MVVFEVFRKRHPVSQCRPVPEETIAKYADRLPEPILQLWREEGWCAYSDGLIWFVNPDDYAQTAETFLKFFRNGKAIVFARNGFGDLYIWFDNAVCQYCIHLGLEGRAANDINEFVNTIMTDDEWLANSLNIVLFKEAIKKLGGLTHHDCFTFVHTLPTGGEETIENIAKANHLEQLAVMIPLGSPKENTRYQLKQIEMYIADLDAEEEYLRAEAAENLCKVGRPAEASLIKVLNDSTRPLATRQYAAEILGFVGSSAAIDALVKLLNVPSLRYHILLALAKIGDARVPPHLMGLLDDPDDYGLLDPDVPDTYLRLQAMDVLCNIARRGHPIDVGDVGIELLTLALQDNDEVVRRYAAVILGAAKVGRVVEQLLVMLRADKSLTVRIAAIEALEFHGAQPEVQAAVTGALEAANVDVRFAAAQLLRTFVDKGVDISFALPGLLKVRNDRDKGVRGQAVCALGKIRDEQATEAVISALEDPNFSVRMYAAEQFEAHPTARAMPGLVRLLLSKKEESSTYMAAANALAAIGDVAAVTPLITFLNTSPEFDTATDALEVLWQKKPQEVLAVLQADHVATDHLRTFSLQYPQYVFALEILAALGQLPS
jgi:HEAT repeat protein